MVLINDIEVNSKGTHSGRVCQYLPSLPKIENATVENGYYILADHSRFKGGRAANVEVHGGATLEEVIVPIIEITRKDVLKNIEVHFKNNSNIIYVSYRKKASLELHINSKNLKDVKIKINDIFYNAKKTNDEYLYIFEMPELKKAQKYKFDLYVSNVIIKTDLEFEIKKEGSQENELF